MYEESIKTYFEREHDRLDQLFKQFRELKQTDFQKAKEHFEEFKIGLQRHKRLEEEILFPLFDQKTGMTMGPTRLMRREHKLIRYHLEAIHKKVQNLDPESGLEDQLLLSVLSAHHQKEENVLYPTLDQLVTDADRVSVFEAMKNLPEERYTT